MANGYSNMEVTGNLDKINRGQWSRNRTLSREQRIEDAEEKGKWKVLGETIGNLWISLPFKTFLLLVFLILWPNIF